MSNANTSAERIGYTKLTMFPLKLQFLYTFNQQWRAQELSSFQALWNLKLCYYISLAEKNNIQRTVSNILFIFSSRVLKVLSLAQIISLGYNVFMYLFFFFAAVCSLWDLSSPTTEWTQVPAVKAPTPNHWPTKVFHTPSFFHLTAHDVYPLMSRHCLQSYGIVFQNLTLLFICLNFFPSVSHPEFTF